MDADREKNMACIKQEIEQGSYRIDPKAVADAILLRLSELAAAAVTPPAQKECS
jgi:anti-sigma28 factor (negative regulator of flagellin synthesis)